MALVLTSCALALFAVSAVSDLRERRIPNLLTLSLALVGLARIGWGLAAGAPAPALAADLAVGAAVFALATVGFGFGLLGGGDVKLMAAGALWLGAGSVLPFLMATALAGGLLAMIFVARRLLASGRSVAPSLPYGIAIAAGGILCTGLPSL